MEDPFSARRRARKRGFKRFLHMWFSTIGIGVTNALTLGNPYIGWGSLGLNAVFMVAAAYDLWALRQRGPGPCMVTESILLILRHSPTEGIDVA